MKNNRKKIWAHTLVYNEENFIWFAITSIIDYVDKILVWDTGSSDSTIKIINELIRLYPKKIEFKQIGKVDRDGVTSARQAMLEKSKCDWILILDGDEIWPVDSIKKIVDEINKNGNKLDGIAVPFYNLLGDIYHYQEGLAGKYELMGKKGHLQIRAINHNIPGLYIKGTYPLEAFMDKNNVLLQRSNQLIYLNDAPYLHGTHLKRSSKSRKSKFKYEFGIKFPEDFKYPEVFSKPYPKTIPSPWIKRGWIYEFLAILRTPIVYLNRRIFNK